MEDERKAMGDDNRGMADDDHFASSRMRQSHMFSEFREERKRG